MQTEDLLKLANWANTCTRKVVPFSANLDLRTKTAEIGFGMRLALDDYNKLDISQYEPKINRQFLEIGIELIRCDAKDKQAKKVLNEIFQWHLNYSQTEAQSNIFQSQIWLESQKRFVPFSEIRNLIKSLNKDRSKDNLEHIETETVRSIKAGVGNCTETSSTAMLFLMECTANVNGPIKIERVGLPRDNGDHVFLLLNRTQGDLNKPETWNEDTVICDPWSNEAYTIKQLFESRSQQKQEFIKLFYYLQLQTPYDGYFIGSKYNKRVHSEKWDKKHNLNNNNNASNKKLKFWRPERLIGLRDRPEFLPELPPTKLTFPELLHFLQTLPETEFLNYLEKYPSLIKHLVTNVYELQALLDIVPKQYKELVLKKLGFENIILIIKQIGTLTGDDLISGILTGLPKWLVSVTTTDAIKALVKEENAATILVELLISKLPFCGQTGLELFMAHSPDVLIEMLMMKNNNGITTLQQMLRLDLSCSLQILRFLEKSYGIPKVIEIAIPAMAEVLKKEYHPKTMEVVIDWILAMLDCGAVNNSHAFVDCLLTKNGILLYDLANRRKKSLIQALDLIMKMAGPEQVLAFLLDAPIDNRSGLRLIASQGSEKLESVLNYLSNMTTEYQTNDLLNISISVNSFLGNTLKELINIPRGYEVLIRILNSRFGTKSYLHHILSTDPDNFSYLAQKNAPESYYTALIELIIRQEEPNGISYLLSHRDHYGFTEFINCINSISDGILQLIKAFSTESLNLFILAKQNKKHLPKVLDCLSSTTDGIATIAAALATYPEILALVIDSAAETLEKIIVKAPDIVVPILDVLAKPNMSAALITDMLWRNCNILLTILQQAIAFPCNRSKVTQILTQEYEGGWNFFTFLLSNTTNRVRLKQIIDLVKQYNMLDIFSEALKMQVKDGLFHNGKTGREIFQRLHPDVLFYFDSLVSSVNNHAVLFHLPANTNENQSANNHIIDFRNTG